MARLLLDTMCGTLATYLRMCGHDVASVPERDADGPGDEPTLAIAEQEGRRVVTRDRALAERAEDPIRLDATDVEAQLRTVAAAGVDCTLPTRPRRCSACNGELDRVSPDDPTPDYAPAAGAEAVWRCPDCGQHFWRGSHWDDVAETLAGL